VSCFALHPIYIDLLEIARDLPRAIVEQIGAAKWEFEQEPALNYPVVYKFKMRILRQIYDVVSAELPSNRAFAQFVENEGEWLKPYALYCYLRDQNGTSDFHLWPKYATITPREVSELSARLNGEIQFTFWLQFVCDQQFQNAKNYAHDHAVVLKGDLPIGVYLNSCECWIWPKNFRLGQCAGAPPDAFSGDGQNWGFPTYDWDFMEADDYSWWRLRLRRMSKLFQALRVDHVLGFFRIWEIPRATAIRGILGHFFPCLPITTEELLKWGLSDIDRYVKPYVRWHLLIAKFGPDARRIAARYFIARQTDPVDDFFDFRGEVDTEQKIAQRVAEDFPDDPVKQKQYQIELLRLLGNVLLIPADEGGFHVRTEVTVESIKMTKDGPVPTVSSSWSELPDRERYQMRQLYIDFTYKRQTDFWISKANQKLSILNGSTNMLVCAEDLGQINEGLLGALRDTGMLGLRVQRMSKDPTKPFDEVQAWQYLSVCCPATHDMTSLRGWWEENRVASADFWHSQLGQWSKVPDSCEPFVLEMILKQHLESNSMWAIFLLQDLTGLSYGFRRQPAQEERINDPSDSHQKWRYRYPFSLKELLDDWGFTSHVRGLVDCYRRI
jgi:4-alpha-glucanotransferase